MEGFIPVDEGNFPLEVLQSELPVVLEFGAPWCQPCKRLEPELLELGKLWAGKARLGKVDVDQSPNLAAKFGVMGVPTVILFVKGQPKERLSGYVPRQRLAEKLEPYL
jgi:thioredoxin 1